MLTGDLIKIHEAPMIETQIVSVERPSERHARIREWEQQAIEDAPEIIRQPVEVPVVNGEGA